MFETPGWQPQPGGPHSCAPFVLLSLLPGDRNLEGSSSCAGDPWPGGDACDSVPAPVASRPGARLAFTLPTCNFLTVAATSGLLHILSDVVSAPRQLCSLTPLRSVPA